MCICQSNHCYFSIKPICLWFCIPCCTCDCKYDVNANFTKDMKQLLLVDKEETPVKQTM